MSSPRQNKIKLEDLSDISFSDSSDDVEKQEFHSAPENHSLQKQSPAETPKPHPRSPSTSSSMDMKFRGALPARIQSLCCFLGQELNTIVDDNLRELAFMKLVEAVLEIKKKDLELRNHSPNNSISK